MFKRSIVTMLAIGSLLTFTVGCGTLCELLGWGADCSGLFGPTGTNGGTNGDTNGDTNGGADASAGATFYESNNCAICHGADGSTPTNIQSATAASILANLDGTDTHPVTVTGVTQADADNVAAWLATQ